MLEKVKKITDKFDAYARMKWFSLIDHDYKSASDTSCHEGCDVCRFEHVLRIAEFELVDYFV